MGYAAAEAHLNKLGIDAMKSLAPSLQRMEAICEALDHPERSLNAIHIAGTNGKSSVARLATALLQAAGLSVGTFTSPHLESVVERIAFTGEPLSREQFGDAFDHLEPYLDLVQKDLGEELSYFEVLTAMFFLWASDQPVDAAVIEVGLGGRWDATNLVPADIAVITNIDMDHVELLGPDLGAIAAEKAGVIKEASTVVVGERRPDALAPIATQAEGLGAELRLLGREFSVTQSHVALGGRYLDLEVGGTNYDSLFLPVHGSHQATNAALALAAVNAFLAQPLSTAVVQEGFGAVKVPGRMESIRVAGKLFLLDVAHNPAGMSAFVTGVLEAFAFDRACVIFGALSDKDHGGMLSELARLEPELIVTQPHTERAVPAAELSVAAKEFALEASVVPGIGQAVAAALRSDADLVAVTGSHYLVGEARRALSTVDTR
ncbi:MAG: folylpolyglutamate synthase/dihydrofolate synthase family protein [Actinomycetota bacterium]